MTSGTRSRDTKEILYTCKITIIRVTNVPVADFNDLSCDPYLEVTLAADTLPEPNTPQILNYRTRTCRRTLHPEFNEQWIVAGIPESGCLLSCKLRDEDPGNYDDDLGKSVLRMPNAGEGKLSEGWKSGDREYKVHKRKGSIMSKIFTCTARIVTSGDIGHRVRLWVSMEVLSKSDNQDDRRLYTVGPHRYARHFSPLLGRFLGSSNSPDNGVRAPGSKVKPSAFVANRLQLAGPVPETLRHRYVGFAPFVKAMFKRRGIRGIVLHHTLHKQHLSIYKWDKNVVYGTIGDTSGNTGSESEKETQQKNDEQGVVHKENGVASSAPSNGDQKDNDQSVQLARQFLRMTSFGTHGRVFTYVITLDGEWRFTETGEQFAIEFLSKHTMHSDVAIEIAYSGEFFVRRLRHHKRESPKSNGFEASAPPNPDGDSQEQGMSSNTEQKKEDEEKRPGADLEGRGGASHQETSSDDVDESESPPEDPALYELVIDNDSGTYRPRADLLPTLHSYLASPRNLCALGRVTCIQAFDDRLKKWKEARKEVKKQEGATKAVQPTSSLSSSASSSVSSLSNMGGQDGDNVQVGDMRAVLEEDAKRARDNDDKDKQAESEEQKAS